jgi:putative redox protein
MKVKVRQKADFHFIGTGEDFTAELPIDAAAHVGGKGRGFRPPGLLMYSVASCMGIHAYEELHKAGKHVENVEVETVSATRRDTSPKVFTAVTLQFRMKGKGVTDEDIKAGILRALTTSCSIAVMVNMVTPLTCKYEVDVEGKKLTGTVTAPPAKL